MSQLYNAEEKGEKVKGEGSKKKRKKTSFLMKVKAQKVKAGFWKRTAGSNKVTRWKGNPYLF